MLGKFICYKKKQTSKPKTVKTKQKKDVLIERALGVQWLDQTTKFLGIVNILNLRKRN